MLELMQILMLIKESKFLIKDIKQKTFIDKTLYGMKSIKYLSKIKKYEDGTMNAL